MPTTPTKKINMTTYFENLTIELHVFYVLKTHIKIYAKCGCYLLFDS